MRFCFFLILVATSTLYAEKKKNILLICVDDLRPELNCYGASYIRSPHIDSLAKSGRLFSRHYVQAPTCGASRYALLTGTYGGNDNYAFFSAAKQEAGPIMSMPRHFREHGYTTVSVGKISHHPGGRGGKNWNDDNIPEMPGAWTRHLMPSAEWQHPRGSMHGLAHGEIRKHPNNMAVYQAVRGGDEIYPDGPIADEGLKQLDLLAKSESPFFLALGIIRPHLPFGCPAKYLEPYKDLKLPAIPHPHKPTGLSTWHGSGEFRKYNNFGKDIYTDSDHQEEVRRHYAACVTYADALIGRILDRLNELKLRDNTIIVLWGDHGWHLGEHAIWGKHSLFEESLRSPLIISSNGMVKPGVAASAIVETCDIFPTLCDLSGIEPPPDRNGESLVPILQDPSVTGEPAISYRGSVTTIRTDLYRLIVHKRKGDFAYELYDHTSKAGETENIANQNPDIVKELHGLLKRQLGR